MSKLKKKLIAGLLSGAIIFTGGLCFNSVQAQSPTGEQQQSERRHERPQMTNEQLDEYSKQLAEHYGLDQAEISDALKNRVNFEDVRNAATLAKISGKSFSEVLAMKNDWRQVAEKLGVTREQVEDFMKNEMLDGLAKRSKLDTKTVESLLKEKYDPRDISIAGIIADASGKNIKSILDKRKINNTWEEVAKEFNIDLQKIMKQDKERPN